MTGISIEAIALERMPCIRYLVYFHKNQGKIQVLIDFASEVNTITPAYTLKLGFIIWITDIGTQKLMAPFLLPMGWSKQAFYFKIN